MGVFEEAKIRLSDIQKRINRVRCAGDDLTNTPTNQTAKTKFRMMYATVSRLQEEFESQIAIIIKQLGKPDQKSDEDTSPEDLREKFDEAYFSIMIVADEYIPTHQQHYKADETFIEASYSRNKTQSIPLEKLSIPRFKGDVKEYTGFRNLFDTFVHNNSEYQTVVKFSYLRAYLEGEPLKIITNLTLSDDNYNLALKLLDNRYSNRRIIAQSHFDQLWNMPKAVFGDEKSIRQVLSIITESVGALKNQGYAVDQWDPILLHLFQMKIDQQLRVQWELVVDTNDDPSVDEFTTFLTKFCKAASASRPVNVREKVAYTRSQPKLTTLHTSQQYHKSASPGRNYQWENKRQFTCQVCKAKPGHLLIACSVFKGKTPRERYQTIRELHRCFLCFSEHTVSQCKHNKLCSECGGRHHSLLHFNTKESESEPTAEPPTTPPTMSTCFSSLDTRPYHTSVLMSTIIVHVQDANGHQQEARALLDSGSQTSFITEYCRKRLGLSRQKCCIAVQAVAGMPVPSIKAKTILIIRPVRQETPQFTVDAFVLPQITGLIPSERMVKTEWPHINSLDLADPRYNEPAPIDILLGAEVFPYVIRENRREGTDCEPVAIETVFGWVLMGRSSVSPAAITTTLCTSLDLVNTSLRRFWEIEELPNIIKTSPTEEQCEKIYHTTTTRQSDGRYVVHLPFIEYPPPLGESRHLALRRLMQLESRLAKSTQLRSDYNEAMYDYLDSGHMNRVETTATNDTSSYYIPHHAVLKPGSTTTKVRVVYDASSTSNNGKSLNDYLYPGPKLQQDLPGIIIRFRLHKVVFTTDIKQMFRQIVVTPDHRPYQRLLFRFKPSDPVQTFEMSTVTFGQRSSPFLAIRTLHQLATDEAAKYPAVERIIRNDLYVDDVATGADCESSALQLQQDLIKVFNRGCFELRKWSSNSVALLEAVPPECRQTDPVTFDEPTSEYTKVLGLKWEPYPDILAYQYEPNSVRFNKRAILSEIARIYDPIGLLTPVITNLKCLMKYLWSVRVGWDDQIPEDAAKVWSQYHEELPVIGLIKIPRQVTTEKATYELHGFCDSSEIAYAAAVYLLVRSANTTQCRLLMGKSKVAPEKKLSIPRLELCGALLLARTMEYLQTNLTSLQITNVTAWCDSTVVLTWIQMPTARLKTFVANRVAQIQHMTSSDIWRHIPTAHNPADCATRGLTPKEIIDHPIWWTGPKFLTQPSDTWPQVTTFFNTLEPGEHNVEEKPLILLAVQAEEECKLLTSSADLPKVLRLTAYWLRLRRRLAHQPMVFDENKSPGVKEKNEALFALLRWVQRVHFAEDLKLLTSGQNCSTKLRLLKAFIDPMGDLLRVGGRLREADLPFKTCHPILLPKHSQLTVLLIDFVHRYHCHPGAQTTQNILQQEYWIISARSVIRKRLRQCVSCFKASPKPLQPSMGDLPKPRLVGIKPFSHVGVDFAGPFMVKSALLRRIQTTKGYLCIFVCMATRAVHLELVSDLSTALFLAAFDRFISRRGRCTDLYSDCGTNFVGAKRYLKEVQNLIDSPTTATDLDKRQIQWHLNPPAAPHMGGLWEAAVKSAKTLLHRTIHDQTFTYEELNTIFHRVEATLNSRPIGAMSSDPNDPQPLTAGHFLTMGPLGTLPAPTTASIGPRLGLRQRWALVQRIQLHFWERWQKDYLHTLQVRSKWNKDERNLLIGDLVMVKEPTPPLTWKTARVVEVHPGEDDVVRVATVRDADGNLYRRPAAKLCLLPLDI